jgi:RNA recognition motif-containing protein
VMGSAEDVNSAVENLNGIEYEGRLLRVDKVENKPPPRQD